MAGDIDDLHSFPTRRSSDLLASGLFIPDGSRAGYDDVAEILAIGPKVDVKTLGINIGDRVMFRRRPGSAILPDPREDRKSTRLNSSHGYSSYAVFCLKKRRP